MLSSSLLLTRRFAVSQVKRRFLSDATGSIPGGSSGAAIVRRKVSLAERAQLRAARKERATRLLQQNSEGTAAAGSSKSSTNSSRTARLSFMSRYMWHIGLGVPTILLLWGVSDENSPPVKLAEALGLTSLVGFVMDQFSKPKSEKMLPDWSDIPNVPKGQPQPITLVIDLEKTLVSSTWDRKNGWRHAKRPGVDKFLFEMGQYYEVVLFSPSLDVVAGPVIRALDSNHGNILHCLFRDATYYTNGVHVKDLSVLNRNVKRVIVLDDDPEEVQFHPDNLIPIKPFEDPTDFSDRSLARITPFLIEIAREDCQDVPALLRQYRGMDADQIADEFENRLGRLNEERTKHMKRRVVGFLVKDNSLPPPELAPVDPYLTVTPSLTSKDLVGPAPNNDLEKPGLLGRFNRHAKAKAEIQQLRQQQINEWFYKKQMEQMEAAERKAKEDAAHS